MPVVWYLKDFYAFLANPIFSFPIHFCYAAFLPGGKQLALERDRGSQVGLVVGHMGHVEYVFTTKVV